MLKRLLFGLEYCVCTFGGIEGALLSAALSGVGMIMQQNAADEAASRQQRIINRAEEEAARLNKQKADTIETFARDTFDPAKRSQRYEEAATKEEKSLVDTLMQANAAGNGGEVSKATEGALSADYERARGASTAAAAEDIAKRARLMARQGAGSLMFNDEMLKGGQLASDVAGINYAGNRNARAARTQLGAVRNDGSLAGGLLMGMAPAAGAIMDNYGSLMQLPKGYDKFPKYEG